MTTQPSTHTVIVLQEDIYPLAGRPTPQCHASTIVETAAGSLLAAWFGGTKEGNPDVGIWLARREPSGWTRPIQVATGLQPDGTRQPCWNPVLFQPRPAGAQPGPLMLFIKVGPNPKQWWGELLLSENDGQSWPARRRLPAGILGPIKNKPEQLADGTLLCPSSTEHDGWRVHLERTSDTGRTWNKVDVPDPAGFESIQPALLNHGSRILCRSRGRQVIAQAWAQADGTWGPLVATDLPNPNSGIDAVTLHDGRHLLVYNPVTKGRTPLTVALSEDGQTWRPIATLEDTPGEYSYPAIIQTRDHRIHITYTCNRQTIRHVELDLTRLR